VLQDLAKIGIVKPGKLKFASRYADPDLSQIGRGATFHIRNRQAPYSKPGALTFEFSLWTVNATAVACSVSLHEGTLFTAGSPTRQFVSLDAAHQYCLSSPSEDIKPNLHPARSAILEMRPAHTPLEEMASEEMSEFDRDYPW
jgi:hypothetical protein